MAFRLINLTFRRKLLLSQPKVLTQVVHMIKTTSGLKVKDDNVVSEAASSGNSPADMKKGQSVGAKKIEGQLRIKRRPIPGKVIWGFVPVEWAHFFYEKTGVTGFYTFVFTFGTYLASKEKLVMEHEYYTGLGTLVFWILAAKYVAPLIAKEIDKEIDSYEIRWNVGRYTERMNLTEEINRIEESQKSIEANMMIVAARREAIILQQEAEYRHRFMGVYHSVLERLNYQLKIGYTLRSHIRRNMVEWIRTQVLAEVTPEWNAKYTDHCIDVLNKLPRQSVTS